MLKQGLTLQYTLALAILLIGLTSVALLIFTDTSYRQLAFTQQKSFMQQLLAMKSGEMVTRSNLLQHEIAEELQHLPAFKQALQEHRNTQNRRPLQSLLDREFNRYYVTTGLLQLQKILILNNRFELIAASGRGLALQPGELPCNNNRQLALTKQGTSLTAATSTVAGQQAVLHLCQYQQQLLNSRLFEVDKNITGAGSSVYIQIITDPVANLAGIAAELTTPLRILGARGQLLHQSADWPQGDHSEHLLSELVLSQGEHEQTLRLQAANRVHELKQQLDSTRHQVVAGSLLLTLASLLAALWLLQRGLSPLKQLRKAAVQVSRGEFTTIDEQGYSEIRAPIRAFNLMSQRIQSLIDDLRVEARSHQGTEEQLKKARDAAEQNARHAEQQTSFLQMTLQSIVDGVITTTIDGYVKTMNPMAEQLTGWSEDEARGQPLVLVMHALKEDTHKRIYDPTENIEYKSVLDEPVSALLIQKNSNIETPVEYVAAPMRDADNTIAGIVVIIHDESVQRSLNRQLTFQATHDALTGLINRYEFERRLKAVISRQQQEACDNTLCYIDLDQFKLVNDTCGHTAGDELLKQITMLLENTLDGAGTLARLGGDEFGLLLEGHNANKAQMVAGRLLMVIQQFQFHWQDNTFTIGASIGVAEITRGTVSCEEILSNADSACYLAKESGRNRIQVYTDMDDKLLTQQREMHWVSRINHALEDNRFQLYFQEILPLDDKEPSAMLHGEVLLRMIDREGDIVSPDNFLPAAEHYNMITLIDEWVVDKALQWLASRKEAMLLSINLSGVSVSNRDFLNFMVSRIKQYQVKPQYLCFEITETAAISHLSRAIHFMTALKKLGCSFALDDFGSGLSSFSYLTSLPVDYLKIDGSFVMDIDKDPMHYAMVKSINEVGQVMKIKTIAEFAASEAIIRCLQDVGVDHAQGYAISRPVPLESLDTRQRRKSSASNVISLIKNDKNAG